MKYPKIQTLYRREEDFKVSNTLSRLEFELIREWIFTEKIDGQGIRVILYPDFSVEIKGRTDKSQLNPQVLSDLTALFPSERMRDVFAYEGEQPTVILYGEGYGEKIQGNPYKISGHSFSLFDVRVADIWLEWDSIVDIAEKLEINTVPVLGMFDDYPTNRAELKICFPSTRSLVRIAAFPEGVVARTIPTLLTRRGKLLRWKLKFKDFREDN